MSEQGAQAVAAAIAALGDPQALAGEGSDRKYDVDGRAWRVRVMIADALTPVAPVNGAPNLAPAVLGISVSAALLDDDGAVALDAGGALLVFPATRVTFDADALARPDFDPAQALDHAIATAIAAAAGQLDGRAQLAAALAPWTAHTEGGPMQNSGETPALLAAIAEQRAAEVRGEIGDEEG
jgi:hypothetical protein